jgi:hypothetical protein
VHQVGRQPHQQPTLAQRIAHEGDVALGQVADPAVDQFRGSAAGARREVRPLHQAHAVPAAGGAECHAGPGDAAADDEHIDAPHEGLQLVRA